MFCVKQKPWFASSPDLMAIIDLAHVDGTEESVQVIAVVEFKTGVGSETTARYVRNACADIRFCEFGDATCRSLVPQQFMTQMLMQMYTTSTSYSLFVSASESCVCFSVILHLPDPIQSLLEFIMSRLSDIVSWAHVGSDEDAHRNIPEGLDATNRKIIESNLLFWRQVNERVRLHGPFPPLKLFKNAVQTFYSKTKPGVDGLTQNREVLANASANFKWEQMIATKGLQTCASNAHVAYKLYSRKDDLTTTKAFGDLSKFRARVAHVEGFSTFCYEGAMQLITLADGFEAAVHDDVLNVDNETPTATPLSARKRNRIDYWNEPANKSRRYVVEC